MPVYDYKALDKQGKKLKGIIDSDNEKKARGKLRAQGIYPVSLKENRNRTSQQSGRQYRLSLFDRIKSEEVSAVTRQLATLVGAGIPLVTSLSAIIEQSDNPSLKKVLVNIRENVNEGTTLSNALSEHRNLFSEIYVNMVRAGEASGSLGIVLDKLADFGEKQESLKGKIKSALIYPLFMAVIGTAILILLLTYIVPNITQVFEEMNKVLPAPTLFLLGMSNLLKSYWWGLIVGLLITVFMVKHMISKPFGRAVWDKMKLRLPAVGRLTQKVILVRFAATLGSLLESGVDLMASMKIVKALANNVEISEVIDSAMLDIEKGKSMTHALSSSIWFPPMFVQMISVGEQSGNMENMLHKAAAAYEREVENAIVGMTSLIEPVMIATMGGVVGFIVLSILLPIFEMNQMIG